jgi:hypothetical protein
LQAKVGFYWLKKSLMKEMDHVARVD